jgi:hypothetical protein
MGTSSLTPPKFVVLALSSKLNPAEHKTDTTGAGVPQLVVFEVLLVTSSFHRPYTAPSLSLRLPVRCSLLYLSGRTVTAT